MKILVICDKPLFPATSGGALAVSATVQGLGNNGAMVDVVSATCTTYESSIENSDTEILVSGKYTSIRIDTRIKAIHLILNLLFSKKPYNIQRYLSGEFALKLSKIIKNKEYDIIQIEGINMSVYTDMIRSHSKALISYRAHNIESDIWKELAFGELNKLKKNYYNILARRIRRYESQIISKCDLLVPISPEDSLYFKKAHKNIPSFTCPFGTDIQEDASTIAENEGRDLIYIGSLDWRPNQEGLIWFINTVWKRVLDSDQNIKLRIAGRNAPPWLIDKLKIKGIEFVGEIKDAAGYISSGKILIIPLLSGSGIRVRILQAMSLGVPVITTKKGLQGINANSPEELLLAQNSEQFYKHIKVLSTDKNSRIKQVNNARKFIKENYNNLKLNRALLNFYQDNRV